MAVLAAGVNAVSVYSDGHADKVVLVALRNATANDTLDLGAPGLNQLQVINRVACISVTSFVEIAANFAGTVITIPSGFQNDAGYLLAWGSGIG